MRCKILLIATVLVLHQAHQTHGYRVGVQEHYPESSDSPENIMIKNLERYREYTQKARDAGVNLVVFPEYGLTTLVKDPENYAIDLSDNTTKIITELKALSKEQSIYLVVNLLEKVTESNKKVKYYNTNLVFDRNGDITAKYRKINIDKNTEPKLTAGTEIVTFTTEFGITFGLFTGSDILYYNPSKKVLENNKVTDIAYPSALVSTVPFFGSLSVQQGYAIANGVNLLAAHYGNPKAGHGGSGIYSPDGKKETYIDGTPSSKFISRDLTTISSRQEPTTCSNLAPQGLPVPPDQKIGIKDYAAAKDFKADKFQFKNLDITQNKISESVCNKEFCCNFNLTISEPNQNEHYKLVAFGGDASGNQIGVCSLVACTSDSNDSCGERINGATNFVRLRVEATLPTGENIFYRPLSLNYQLQPFDMQYCAEYYTNTKTALVRSFTYTPQKGVVSFGLYASPVQVSSAGQNTAFYLMVFLAVFKAIFL